MSINKGYHWIEPDASETEQSAAEIAKAKAIYGVIDNPFAKFELNETPVSTAGREHYVFKSPRYPGDIFKITFLRFGFCIGEKPGSSENAPTGVCDGLLLKSNESASEYVRRLFRQNTAFGDKIEIMGIWAREKTFPQFVIKQPFRSGHATSPAPTQNELEQYMEARGFLHLPADLIDNEYLKNSLFYHEKNNLLVADARPPNFVRTPDGALIPVDLICQRPGEKMKECILRTSRR